jgi:hypothetical protein
MRAAWPFTCGLQSILLGKMWIDILHNERDDMSNTNNDISYYDLILPNPTSLTILMKQEEDGWILPGIRFEDAHWWRDIGSINREIGKALGGLRALRCVSRVENPKARVSRRVYLVENIGFLETSVEGTWVDRERVSNIRLKKPEQKEMIENCLDEIEGVSPYHRPAWTQPGWLEPAIAWFEGRLSVLEYGLISSVDYQYSWPLGAVLCARTTKGDVYMKATSIVPESVDETVLTVRLASLFPDYVPAPLAVEPERR